MPAQEFIERITQVFEHEIGQQKDTTHYHTKFVLAPIISYEPATSLGVGVGTKLLFKFPKSFDETRTSNLPFSVRYTLKKQFIFGSDFVVFTNQEKWMFKGAISFLKFPSVYYGVGTDTKRTDKIDLSFKQFLFEPIILKKVRKYLFLGGGLRYNTIYNVKALETHTPENFSWQDSLGVKSLGLELAVSYDSRDNVLNASKGCFLEYTIGAYDEEYGSSHSFKLSKLDFRYYVEPWETRDDVLAFELFSKFSWGDVPLSEYSNLGGESLLRGVAEGRYRDNHVIFLQAEYRWNTFERLGFVFYTGAGDVYNRKNSITIDTFKFNVGTGLRLKIVKSENLNIRVDYGFAFGNEFESNLYLGIAEAF